MKKLQQFYILKFDSDRLKNANYDIDISFDDARINNEIVTINNSELVRTLFRYKGVDFDQNEIDNLLILRKKIEKHLNSEQNREKMIEIMDKIKNLLYIQDFISVKFKNKTHYLEILKRNGFYVNGIRFTPFLASAGMIRRNTAMFVNNNIKHPLMDILENNRDEGIPIVPAKWGAYFSLYSSSTLPVSFPKFAVVSDKEIETIRKVDFVTYQGIGVDDEVTEQDKELKLNAWDGQGLISPKLAEQWSQELDMDYRFSCAIIRAPFLKGLVTVFDMNDFATTIAKKYTFTDIYGNEKDIRDIDLIVTESMFKLKDSYKDTEEYIEKCHKNKLGFSIAKVNPYEEKSHSRTSYQFLQILDLNDADVAKLCQPTLDWFRSISGGSAEDMLLYATGESKFKPEDFDKMDISVKAILLNPLLARDTYIQNKFIKTINKKKRESYMGSLLINANYQFMVSDPYYQMCHIFNLETEPLLKDGEHYSSYWLERNINKVVAIRSPIVHHSELNVLNFKNTKETKKWYKHIESGIIFPANGIGTDCVIHGGADFDGDLICTINNETMKKGRVLGLPIMYESKKADKKLVDSRNDKEQVKSQLMGHNSKVGFATNVSSSFYTMLEEFEKGTPEREAIENRLKIGRVIQGEIIDSVKGLDVPPFREHWTKYTKIEKDMSKEEVERATFNNNILCKKRPSYFRFLYPHYMTKYNKELKKYNIFSLLNFGLPFSEIFRSKNKTIEQEELVKKYKWHSYFLDNDSVMNRISHYMRTSVALVSRYSRKASDKFEYLLLQESNFKPDEEKLEKMRQYLKEYKEYKKRLREKTEIKYGTIDAFMEYLRKKCYENISTNSSELASYSVQITYGEDTYMVEFPWRMFPNGILENIMINSPKQIEIPVSDKNGDIEYLWKKYSFKTYNIEDLYEK